MPAKTILTINSAKGEVGLLKIWKKRDSAFFELFTEYKILAYIE